MLTLAVNPDAKARDESFERLKKLHASVMTPEFPGRLLARTLSLLPVIRQNAGIFADAIARSGKTRRMGDTYGVLMAGSWSLRSRDVATAAEADKMVAETPWVQKAVRKESVAPEYERALDELLQSRTRIINRHGRTEEVPISELIRISGGINEGGRIWTRDATVELERMGMRVTGGERKLLQIPHSGKAVAAIFSKTPWAPSWASTLKRMPGARANPKAQRIGSFNNKVFEIPISYLFQDGPEV